MVKLRCTLAGCWTRYEASPTEMWICPDCEEYGLAEIEEITQEEIELMWENLQTIELIGEGGKFEYGKLEILKKLKKFIEGKSKVYYGIIEGTYDGKTLFTGNISEHYEVFETLVLLYDVVIVSSVWQDYLSTAIDYNTAYKFRKFIEEGYAIPFGGSAWSTSFLKYLQEEINICNRGYYINGVLNPFIGDNLVSTMTFEDFKDIEKLPRENINNLLNDTKIRHDKKFFAPRKLEFILNTFNRHNLRASILDTPMYVDTDSKAIARWKLSQIANSFNLDIDRRVKITKDFLENITLDIPIELSFDDIKEFKEDKACTNFRKSIFTITEQYRKGSDQEIIQKLLWEFYERRNEFNEAAQSYAQVRTGILTGIVSTIGGLIGGLHGAVIGGAGASAASLLINSFFRKFYERNHKDWAIFLWDWKNR